MRSVLKFKYYTCLSAHNSMFRSFSLSYLLQLMNDRMIHVKVPVKPYTRHNSLNTDTHSTARNAYTWKCYLAKIIWPVPIKSSNLLLMLSKFDFFVIGVICVILIILFFFLSPIFLWLFFLYSTHSFVVLFVYVAN